MKLRQAQEVVRIGEKRDTDPLKEDVNRWISDTRNYRGDLVKTFIGPSRSIKCVGDDGGSRYYRYASPLLEDLDIEHPVSQYVISISQEFRKRYGDGAADVLLYCIHVWSKAAVYLNEQGIPMARVIHHMKAVINGCIQHIETKKLTVSEVLSRHIITGEICANTFDSETSVKTDLTDQKFSYQNMFENDADGLCKRREIVNGTDLYAVDNSEVDGSFEAKPTNVHGRSKTENDASCLQGDHCDRITSKHTEHEERNMYKDLDNVNDYRIEVTDLEMTNIASGKDGDDVNDTSWFFNDCATTVDENLLEEPGNKLCNQNENVQVTDIHLDKDVSVDNNVVDYSERLDDKCNSDDTDGIVRDIEKLKVDIENDLQKLMKRKDRKKQICETEQVISYLKSDTSIDEEFDICFGESNAEFDNCFAAGNLTECNSSQKKYNNERKEKLKLESDEFETIEMKFTDSTEMEKIKVVNRAFVNMVKKQHIDDSSISYSRSNLGLNVVDTNQHCSLDVEIEICQKEYLKAKELLKNVEHLNKGRCIDHARDKTMTKETEPEQPELFQELSQYNTSQENTQLPNEISQNLTDNFDATCRKNSSCCSLSQCLERHAHKSHTEEQIQNINALLDSIGNEGETFKSGVSLNLHSKHFQESEIGQLDRHTDNIAGFDSGFSSTGNQDSDRSAGNRTKSEEIPLNQDTFSDSEADQPTNADTVPCKEQSINTTSGYTDNIDSNRSTGNWNILDEADLDKDHHSVPNTITESCKTFPDAMTKQPSCVKTIAYATRTNKYSNRSCGNECKTNKLILEKSCQSHLFSEPYNAYINVQGNRSLNVPSKEMGVSKSGCKINLKSINNMLKDISAIPSVSTATRTLGSTRPGFLHSRHMNNVEDDDSEMQQLMLELKQAKVYSPLMFGVGLSHIKSVNVGNDISISKHESNTESDMTPKSKQPNIYSRNMQLNMNNAVIDTNIHVSSVTHVVKKPLYEENDNMKVCEVEDGTTICDGTCIATLHGVDERSDEEKLNDDDRRLVTGLAYNGDERFVNINKEELKDDIRRLVIGLNHDGDASINSAVYNVVVRQSAPGNHRLNTDIVDCYSRIGTHEPAVVDGVIVNTTVENISALERHHGIPHRALLVNADLTNMYRHKGYKSTKTKKICTLDMFIRHASNPDKWQMDVLAVLNELSVSILFVRGNVSEDVRGLCESHDIVAMETVPYKQLVQLSEAAQADMVTYVTLATEENVCKGISVSPWQQDWCDRMYTSEHAQQEVVISLTESNPQTVVLSGVAPVLIDLKEQELWDCLHRVTSVLHSGYLLPGAGRTEQDCIQLLTENLEMLQKDPKTVINTELQYKQMVLEAIASSFQDYVNLFQGRTLETECVLDCYRSKIETWKLALDAVDVIVNIDSFIVTGASGEHLTDGTV